MKKERLPFDLKAIATKLHIRRVAKSSELDRWLNISFKLEDWEEKLLDNLLSNMEGKVEYWNEEELKMQVVGLIFILANIEEREKIMVFYERPLEAVVGWL
jgi:hypothetical protein